MDVNTLATIAAGTIVAVGAAALVYAMRKAGDTLVEDQEAVERAIGSINRVQLSNALSEAPAPKAE